MCCRTSNLNFFVSPHFNIRSPPTFYAALFLSSFWGFAGSAALHRVATAAAAVMISKHLRASSKKTPALDNEHSLHCALLVGLFCLFVLGIGGCVFHPPVPPHPTTLSRLPPLHLSIQSLQRSAVTFCF